MKYADGRDVRLGDRVALGADRHGVVVCSIDDDAYREGFPKQAWAYLGRGVVIAFPQYGPIHYETAEPDLQLIARAPEP